MMPTVAAAGISIGHPVDPEKFRKALESNEALKVSIISARTLAALEAAQQ